MSQRHGDHPLGTPGASAFRKAREVAAPGLPRVIARFLPQLVAESSAWWKGGVGEEKIARRLSSLSKDRWLSLHDRPLGTSGTNVDHVLIGPGGVFSINSKNLSGKVVVRGNTFYVNGYRNHRYVHAARNEGRSVSLRLSAVLGASVEVTPVIAVVAPELEVTSQPDGVQVLGLRDVPDWFTARPPVLDPAAAFGVYVACRRAGVWTAPVETLGPEGSAPDLLEGLTVNVWRRRGHDRVYVNKRDRSRLGYLDRKTGEVHVEDGAPRDVVLNMLAPYLR